MIERAKNARWRSIALHSYRVSLFAAIILLIHFVHRNAESNNEGRAPSLIEVEEVVEWFPNAVTLEPLSDESRLTSAVDDNGASLGYVAQTSPQGDRFIGFSGPTNVLIAFGADDRIIGVKILSSQDTREHVDQVRNSTKFLSGWVGLSWDEANRRVQVDAVSGATLTSFAIHEAILFRLGGSRPSIRFAEPITLADIQPLFPTAVDIEADRDQQSLFWIHDENQESLGSVLRSSPFADSVIGYQGPTEVWVARGADNMVCGLVIGQSYDNEPYIDYVRDDDYFLSLFNDLGLAELASIDFQEAGVEGVSGATMTSMAVAESLRVGAQGYLDDMQSRSEQTTTESNWNWNALGTITVVISGLVIGLTSLRSRKWLRLSFQLVLIGYLGLINGDLLSQAMFAGWAKHGVPWRTATGLFCLALAALLVPIFTKSNVYCSHLCPHGALQQLVKRRLPWQWRMSHPWRAAFALIPFGLLGWCVLVAVGGWRFSLVDIEPFDAWIFQVAGWSTLAVAVSGLVFSMFVPMGYCRFGCPTGALLKYLRYHRGSRNWQTADWGALALVGLALAVIIW